MSNKEEGEEEVVGVRYFTIDRDSGVIRTTQPLDREAQPWYNITVMASEVGRYPPSDSFKSNTHTHTHTRSTCSLQHGRFIALASCDSVG